MAPFRRRVTVLPMARRVSLGLSLVVFTGCSPGTVTEEAGPAAPASSPTPTKKQPPPPLPDTCGPKMGPAVELPIPVGPSSEVSVGPKYAYVSDALPPGGQITKLDRLTGAWGPVEAGYATTGQIAATNDGVAFLACAPSNCTLRVTHEDTPGSAKLSFGVLVPPGSPPPRLRSTPLGLVVATGTGITGLDLTPDPWATDGPEAYAANGTTCFTVLDGVLLRRDLVVMDAAPIGFAPPVSVLATGARALVADDESLYLGEGATVARLSRQVQPGDLPTPVFGGEEDIESMRQSAGCLYVERKGGKLQRGSLVDDGQGQLHTLDLPIEPLRWAVDADHLYLTDGVRLFRVRTAP